jgi:hypothetical protein
VVADKLLDLFDQFVVCRHALHVARRDRALNVTPERLLAISHAPASLVEALVSAGASLDYCYLGRDPVEFAEWCDRPELVPLLKPRARRAASK